MYKSEILKNRKNLNYCNNVVIVESNEIVNSLKPLTLYQWFNHSNVNIRQYNKNQFGDLIFTTIESAISEKEFSIKELNQNLNSCIESLKSDIKYNRYIRTIKNNIKNQTMQNNYFTVKNITDIIKRYDIKLSLNELKNISLVDTVFYKNDYIESIAINKKSRLQVKTVEKIIDKIQLQLLSE